MLGGVKVGFGVLILLLTLTLYFYPSMPEKVVVHWNAKGLPDRYAHKEGIFVIPLTLLATLIIFELIPRVDPLSRNIKKFEPFYNSLIIVLSLFMAFVQILVLMWNMGYVFRMTSMVCGGIGALFIYLGIVMPNFRRNWFVGIRTPWTLSNDRMWRKTHELGGKLFLLAGILSFLCGLSGSSVVFPVMFILVISMGLVIYSYIIWRRECYPND